MDTAAPTRPKITFPPETWARIKAEACAGVSYPVLSKLYGPSTQVIANRAKFEQWQTPGRLKRLRKGLGEMGNGGGVASGQSKAAQLPALVQDTNLDQFTKDSIPYKPKQLTKDSISRFHSALLDLVSSPPADFQSAFAAVAQSAIAEGVRDVPAPRSIKELATWFDLWRKAAGLDAKVGTPGSSPLVNPLRTVSRRAAGPVVEVAADPVPGSPDWDEWEV